MEPRDYTVTKIDGEYAYLTPGDGSGDVFIALALLPPGTDLGTKLRYEMLSYTVID